MFQLPRLLYLSDVPVESTYHGSALIYRILREYPKDRLMIVEAGALESKIDRRLPGVNYQRFPLWGARWLNTRLNAYLSSVLSFHSIVRASHLPTLIKGFDFNAVLTIAHGYSWLTAAELAKRKDIPLHLIIHDDWVKVAPVVWLARRWLNSQFKRRYVQATSRFCVSPFMEEEFARRYNVRGDVLYPSRSSEATCFDTHSPRIGERSTPLTFVFAGTINSLGYSRALKILADCLIDLKGRLLIYGPLTQENAVKLGLDGENIEIRGLLPSNDLILRLREEADVLYVPMSFQTQDRDNMEIGFPSKLTDYTALGVPMLIHGPSYCSAVRWANENHGVAEVVEVEDRDNLLASIMRLATDSEYCRYLAVNAIRIGALHFSNELAINKVNMALGSHNGL